ncbi:hypothetical protein [Actinoallomurus sp. NPDC052274]|uniref:hypothetical protein n=1 Tax=Actinoallomurus sp. NPDC052274 TaxID=3155420 RepID=UPI00343CD589
MGTTDDPIRAWIRRREEAAQDSAMARALSKAATELGIEDQADEQPADYEPPSVAEQFQQWARHSVHRGGPELPPAA